MKALRKILYCLVLIMPLESIADNIVVIVNPENMIDRLERDEVVDLYMGRLHIFPDGGSALPMDLPPDSNERSKFYRKLVNKSVAKINAYWARLLFTGRASPPKVMNNSSTVLRTVRDNHHAIGYITESQVDDTVKVVFRFE